MSTTPAQIGPYRIDRELGRGGMGVVFLATDTRLDRKVAIKALPDHLAADADRLARFEREAKTLASLSHPNIAQIYGVEEHEGRKHLVLEYVEGETLADRLRHGPLPVDRALQICGRVAAGLEAAHASGVVHRDLKPGNVTMASDGAVKIIDFGLAKRGERACAPAAGHASDTPTLTSPPTSPHARTLPGMILGSAPYMSPEQARGEPVDERTDIWSLGVVLFECLTGDCPFAGRTPTDTLGAVMHREVDLSTLPPEVPPAVRRLLRRCLERDVDRRLHSVADARIELSDPGDEPAIEAPQRRPAAMTLWLLGLGAAFMGFGAAWILLQGPSPHDAPRSTRRFELTLDARDVRAPSISPDGGRVAYIADGRLMVRDLNRFEPHDLGPISDLTSTVLFWSPDSESIGFVDGRLIRRASAHGGEPTTIGVSPVPLFAETAGGAWMRDGRIVYAAGGVTGLHELSASGGSPREFVHVAADERDFPDASPLPDDRGVLFVLHDASGPNSIWVYNEQIGRRLLHDANAAVGDPQYCASGHIIFGRTNEPQGIWALPFSLERLRPTGAPFLVMDGHSGASVSLRGDLAMLSPAPDLEEANLLVWVDRTGRIVDAASPALGATSQPALSPDGGRVAVTVTTPAGDSDVWIVDLVRIAAVRLTHEAGRQYSPMWSQDGERIAHLTPAANLNDPLRQPMPQADLVARRVDGVGSPATLIRNVEDPALDREWSIATFAVGPSQTEADLAQRSLDADAPDHIFVERAGAQRFPALQPGGDLVAYRSDETGRNEIYLTRLPDGAGRWQVSTGGGAAHRWSPEGDRLYFISGGALVESTIVIAGDDAEPRIGRPEVVFRLDDRRLLPDRGFIVDADGARFLMVAHTSDEKSPDSIIVVENWFAEFETP